MKSKRQLVKTWRCMHCETKVTQVMDFVLKGRRVLVCPRCYNEHYHGKNENEQLRLFMEGGE